MPTTAAELFTGQIQYFAPFEREWTDPENVLTTALEAFWDKTQVGYQRSRELEVYGPVGVPPAAGVTNIKIEVRAYTDNNTVFSRFLSGAKINGGTEQASIALTASPATYTFDGAPVAYWGMSVTQLNEFIAGGVGSGFRFFTNLDSDLNNNSKVVWVKSTITYTDPGKPRAVVLF